MTYKQLEYFLAIAEFSNMTTAAKKLNVSQPPLSYQLKLLEDELDVKLFTRTGRTLHITKEGCMFQDKALQIMELTKQSVSLMKNIGKEMSGTINIATIPSVCGYILPQTIHTFQQKYPSVNYQIHECNSFRAIELLDNGIVDLAFVRAPIHQERYQNHIVQTPFLKKSQKDFFVALGSAEFFEDEQKDSIDLKELAGKPLIVHRRYKNVLENFCNAEKIPLKIVCENDYIVSSFNMAEANIGIAIMPYTSAMLFDNKKNLLVKKISHPAIDSKIFLITKKNHALSILTEKFIRQFMENYVLP